MNMRYVIGKIGLLLSSYAFSQDSEEQIILHPYKSDEFAEFIRNDLDTEVARLLPQNISPYNSRYDYLSLLDYMALHGSTKCLQVLLDRGGKPNIYKLRSTPLHTAVECNQHEIIRLLLNATPTAERQEFIEHMNDLGISSLALAAKFNHIESMCTLLSYPETNPNFQDALKGRTALSHAAENGHTQAVVALLLAGANTQLKDTYSGKLPIDYTKSNDALYGLLAKPNFNGLYKPLLEKYHSVWRKLNLPLQPIRARL